MNTEVPARMIDRAVARFDKESRGWLVEPSSGPPRVITISRQLGSGGRRIAERLGGWLGWQVWDREILQVIARESHLRYQARRFEELDERGQSSLDAVAYSLLGDVNKHLYLHFLNRAVRAIARNDAIILGRGAHLLLPDALKIRVVASHETRVANLVQYESISREEARKRIRASDQEREAFLRDLVSAQARSGPEQLGPVQYDLLINTDRFSLEDTTSLIVSAARCRFSLRAGEPEQLLIGLA